MTDDKKLDELLARIECLEDKTSVLWNDLGTAWGRIKDLEEFLHYLGCRAKTHSITPEMFHTEISDRATSAFNRIGAQVIKRCQTHEETRSTPSSDDHS